MKYEISKSTDEKAMSVMNHVRIMGLSPDMVRALEELRAICDGSAERDELEKRIAAFERPVGWGCDSSCATIQ